jgi:hypothetical protein
MKRVFKSLAVLLIFLKVNVSFAGWSVSDAEVIQVINTSGNLKNFTIVTTGGSGPCVGQYIQFPETDAANGAAHQRAYASALLALTTGMKVTVHNYFDDTCNRASFIQLTK